MKVMCFNYGDERYSDYWMCKGYFCIILVLLVLLIYSSILYSIKTQFQGVKGNIRAVRNLDSEI